MMSNENEMAEAIRVAGSEISAAVMEFADCVAGDDERATAAGQIAQAISALGSGKLTPGPIEAIAMGLHAGDGLRESLADKVGENALALDRIADALEGIGSALDNLADAVQGSNGK